MENMEAIFFDELPQVLPHLLLVALDAECDVYELKDEELAVGVVLLFNQLKPVAK